MRIAKEGYNIIAWTVCGAVLLTLCAHFLVLHSAVARVISGIVAALLWTGVAFVLFFFREPTRRRRVCAPDAVLSSVDGKVVVIEEVFEGEYLKRRCLQISVFMSITNIHANWYPVGGRVLYRRYHPGTFLVAWHPKSSEENERTTTVVDTGHEEILFRQIAGLVARRIVNYCTEGASAVQGEKYGFIKFGSRIDIFLPLGSEVEVSLGDRVVGGQTVLARLPRRDGPAAQ